MLKHKRTGYKLYGSRRDIAVYVYVYDKLRREPDGNDQFGQYGKRSGADRDGGDVCI
jgi:hypothetical protein